MSRTATTALRTKLALLLAIFVGAVNFVTDALTPDPNARKRSLYRSNRGQMGDLPSVIIMLGVAIVAGFAILYLSNEVMSIMNVSEGDPLYPAYETLQNATNNVFEMFGFLFVLVILAVGLSYLLRLR